MLPKGYELPKAGGNYLRFESGENRFRIMSDYIVGMEYWVEKADKRVPVRIRMEDKMHPDDLEFVKDAPRHFWACVVYDYADSKIKIMEITQKSLMRTLTGLEEDPDWGDPKGTKGYDVVVIKTGEKMETRYELRAKPKKELDPGIVQLFKDTSVNLNALYKGEDPFAEATEDINIDEVAEALS
jgi:hypothetical protein